MKLDSLRTLVKEELNKKLNEEYQDKFKMVGMLITNYVIDGIIDMFAYAGIMIPCMNAIATYIGKYEMNMDTIIGNLLSLGVAGGALVAKQGINWLMNKLKKSLDIKDINIPDSDDKVISPYDMIDIESETPQDSKLIKEHD